MGSTDKEQKQKKSKKNKKQKHHAQFYYSFLTIILLIALVQVSFSAILLISKFFVNNRKVVTLKNKQITAEAKNAELKKEIKNFSTTDSMESIARNNLKMAGKDEVLVIVNKKEPPTEEGKDKHKKHRQKK